jgi:hypothetical protein
VLDLYRKRVMEWLMHHRQDRRMGVRAVQMAVSQRKATRKYLATRHARGPSVCSSGSACTAPTAELGTRTGPICPTTWSGSMIRECVVELPGTVGRFKPESNRRWKPGRTHVLLTYPW